MVVHSIFAFENLLRRFAVQMSMRVIDVDQEGDVCGAVHRAEAMALPRPVFQFQFAAPFVPPDQPLRLYLRESGDFANVGTHHRLLFPFLQAVVRKLPQGLVNPSIPRPLVDDAKFDLGPQLHKGHKLFYRSDA